MYTYQTESSIGQRVGALVIGPVVGLAYVICMPFLAIATIVTLVTGKAAAGLLVIVRNLATFGWRPSESYLAGKKRKRRSGR